PPAGRSPPARSARVAGRGARSRLASRSGGTRQDGVAGVVVRAPGLRLEGQEDGHPALVGRELEEQRAVLIDAVVLGEIGVVALVHVDVVDAVAGHEPEGLIWLV